MKILIDLPADEVALMRGVAGWHEKTLATWVADTLREVLESDLQGASEDINKRTKEAGDPEKTMAS